jgi:hypothetical protein
MSDFDLQAIDALTLSEEHRSLLRPGEPTETDDGAIHRLPRFFYAVPSWENAHQVQLAPHFKLSELMTVDCREADLLWRTFPHYVPCAVVLLARYLEDFRREAEGVVFISANGGYRSPAHGRNKTVGTHCWGVAADIYRVGDTYLDDEKSITRYADLAKSLGPQVYARPYLEGDDHLHIDLGFITLTPRGLREH